MNVYSVYVYENVFTDIAVIDNLRKFTSLTRLQLNNNLIEKIKGLEHLVNLTWLGKIKLCIQYSGMVLTNIYKIT